jgi:hypothetical protein
MLLLQIKNSNKQSKLLVGRICSYKKLNEKLKKNKVITENLANNKILITTKKFPNLDASDLIKYVLGVSFFKKNIIMYIGCTNGQLKYHCSAGFIRLSKKQKIKIPLVLVKLTKVISIKLPSLTNIPTALHLNNVPKSLQLFFEPVFKTQFFIVQLNTFKLFSHNGCRPKKLKRKKRKKVFFG